MPDPLLPSMLENQVGKNGVWAPQEPSPVLLYSVCAMDFVFLGVEDGTLVFDGLSLYWQV